MNLCCLFVVHHVVRYVVQQNPQQIEANEAWTLTHNINCKLSEISSRRQKHGRNWEKIWKRSNPHNPSSISTMGKNDAATWRLACTDVWQFIVPRSAL